MKDKGRQFGLKIVEQTTAYYTLFNEQHSDTTCRQVGLF
jgi:hypothetical protein